MSGGRPCRRSGREIAPILLALDPVYPVGSQITESIRRHTSATRAEAQAREIARSDVERLAWVSCDPVTFARDARFLADGGYEITRLFVIDQFRWSPHVETVAEIRRR